MILFDFEYTAWEGSQARGWSEPWEHREIIQIAAVRIALSDGLTETSCFERLVRPAHNPILSSYITNLTGIEQSAVDTLGLPFPNAFAEFYQFCNQGTIPLYCYGDDVSILTENFKLHHQPLPPFSAGIFDIRALFEHAGIETRLYTSGTVHQAAGAAFDLAAHNALNDVRSMAAALRQLTLAGRVPSGWLENNQTTGRFILPNKPEGAGIWPH